MSPAEARRLPILPLAELRDGQEADTFAQLAKKEEARTRDHKPYWRVTFRDSGRSVTFPIWNDSPLADEVPSWQVGSDYKLRGLYRETQYGPQLDIRLARLARDEDAADGYDPAVLRPQGRHDPAQLFTDLTKFVDHAIQSDDLKSLVLGLLEEHRTPLLTLPASQKHHHVYAGGWLEHTLNVARNALFLADRYTAAYPELSPPLDTDLVLAGAVLHDIGKLLEIADLPEGPGVLPAGVLIGHAIQGRDLVRDAAHTWPIDSERLLRLEHIILSHHGSLAMGAPITPRTPEALLVEHANDVDSQFAMLDQILRDDRQAGPFTSERHILSRAIYRGGGV